MKTYFQKTKKLILQELDRITRKKCHETGMVNEWGPEVMTRLQHFTSKGKMLRGGFIFFSHDASGKHPGKDAIRLGAAMELVQSGLLIHDDIMDRDTMRRGEPSFFFQYAQLAKKRRIRESRHFGEGMGICAGDIAYFLAYEIIATLDAPATVRTAIAELWGKELAFVGLGQMQDLASGMSEEKTDESVILNVYMYKTARYTFSLPLMTGAILAGAQQREVSKFEKYGEVLGVIFQLKDDELGLFGDEKELGKPVGSDIKEGKKSLYYHYLMTKSNPTDRKRLVGLFHNPNITKKDVELVRSLVRKYAIDLIISDMLQELGTRALEIISSLKTDPQSKRILTELLDYSLKRRS